MANRTLSDLPVVVTVGASDILHTRQGLTDKSVTQDQIAEYAMNLSDYSPVVINVTGAAHTVSSVIRKQYILASITSDSTFTFPVSGGDAQEVIVKNDSASTANVLGLPDSSIAYPGQELTFIWNGAAWKKRTFNTGTNASVITNDFLNGKMEIAQRGTNFVSVANGQYTLDRIRYSFVSSGVVDISQDTTIVPSTELLQHSLKVDVTTADATVTAGDFAKLDYYVEGSDFSKYHNDGGQYGTLGFWAYSTKTGTFCVSFVNSDGTTSYVTEVTIDSASTWEYKPITVLFNDLTGNWDYGNGRGLGISFVLMAGSTFQTTPDTWQSGNFFTTANQDNFLDNAANEFYITGVTFNLGTTPINWSYYQKETEIAKCQRYFEKTYDINTAIGTVTSVGCVNWNSTGSTTDRNMYFFKVGKRVGNPTVTVYSPGTGVVNKIYNFSTASDLNGTPFNTGENSAAVGANGVSSTVGQELQAHVTVDAEL